MIKNISGKWTKLMFIFLFITSFSESNSQIVKGYFPYYRSVSQANAVNYSNLTDVVYAFADLDGNGNLTIRGPGGTGDLTVFNAVKSNCSGSNVKLWIAVGGWGLSQNFSGVAADANKRNTLANACLSLCTTHNLEGIDIDWEFPLAGDKANFTLMLQAIRNKLGTSYKLSAALGGESFTYSCVNQGHAPGVEAAAFTYLDYFNIMSYDAPSCFDNHASVDFTKRAMDGWFAKGCPYEKMLPGIAFYGRCIGEQTYSALSATNPSEYFNDADGILNGWCYDSRPTIELKVNYAMCTKGSPGVMIWELSQDRTDQYSLLSATKAAVNACACPFSDPQLGSEKSLCGVSSITLNSGIATSPNRRFTWKRNGEVVVNNSASANTYVVNSSGNYEVTVTEGTCSKSSGVTVTGTLLVPDLGSSRNLCNPPSLNLTPVNLSSFPPSVTWEWSYNNQMLNEQTGSTLNNVRRPGLYKLKAQATGCAAKEGQVSITSSLPVPEDACSPTTASVVLAISNAEGGPYTWYSASTGGNSLGTGSTFNTPVISSTTTYYVQDGAPGAAGNIGRTDNTGGWFASDYTQKIVFNVLQPLSINSVTVYPSATQNITIRVLLSDNSTIVASKTFNNVGPSGQNLILNFNIPVGNGYLMDAVGTTGSLSYGGVYNFPASIPGIITLTGQIPSWTEADRYNYLFNWSITSGSPCSRMPVIANIGSCPITTGAESYSSKEEVEVLSLIDVLGNPLSSSLLTFNEGLIALSGNLPSGLYIAEIRNGSKVQKIKVFKP
ncbi:MAG: glycosyl hydrolase family 18 protein [Cytophagaceae bacterium]